MEIRHKGIYPNRFDAPFVGTLISAISCPYRCEDCINDPLKPLKFDTIDSNELLDSVVSDPFSEGIILGGLEWTMQSLELYILIKEALERNLKVILYTYHPNFEALEKEAHYMKEFIGSGIYIKFGKYDKTKRSHDNVWYGVPLASSNQYIKQI